MDFCIHRITESFRLEGTFKSHLLQSTYSEQRHLQLDQVAQSPVQPDPECFQGWGIYRLSGNISTDDSHCRWLVRLKRWP